MLRQMQKTVGVRWLAPASGHHGACSNRLGLLWHREVQNERVAASVVMSAGILWTSILCWVSSPLLILSKKCDSNCAEDTEREIVPAHRGSQPNGRQRSKQLAQYNIARVTRGKLSVVYGSDPALEAKEGCQFGKGKDSGASLSFLNTLFKSLADLSFLL